MNTQISTKLAALAVALVMNSLLMGGVAYVFSAEAGRTTTIVAERAVLTVHAVA
jgi:hypothetical protein